MKSMQTAIDAIEKSEVIIIMSGAGMGVDSNLPDFRGDEGMWKAYPALGNKKISFRTIASPKMFKRNPRLAWGFYGHRFNTYKNTTPNIGFAALKELVKEKEDYFIVTSNVDGHFQKAGFDPSKVYEIHGRINKFQCTDCSKEPWEAPKDLQFDIDPKTLEMKGTLPTCKCGSLARPNIMMFNDYQFNASETAKQEDEFNLFMNKNEDKKIVIIEIGAGTAIPTIRHIGENIQDKLDATLIRINPRESKGPEGTISIAKRGVEALSVILPEKVKKMFFIES